jgi:hypothetical protein
MTEQTIAPTTIRIPSGNIGIKLPNGDVVDPCYITAKNLSLIAEQYATVLEWIAAERERRRVDLAEREAQQAERVREIQRECEERTRAREEYLAANPWMK